MALDFMDLHFNTSNVTIQLIKIIYVFVVINISIHLMLLFNARKQCRIKGRGLISIHLMLLFNLYKTFKPVFYR